jgi:hypothetical protein
MLDGVNVAPITQRLITLFKFGHKVVTAIPTDRQINVVSRA